MKHLKLDENEKLIFTKFVSLCAEKNIKKTVKDSQKIVKKVQTAGYSGKSTTFKADKLEKSGILSFYRTIVRSYD